MKNEKNQGKDLRDADDKRGNRTETKHKKV